MEQNRGAPSAGLSLPVSAWCQAVWGLQAGNTTPLLPPYPLAARCTSGSGAHLISLYFSSPHAPGPRFGLLILAGGSLGCQGPGPWLSSVAGSIHLGGLSQLRELRASKREVSGWEDRNDKCCLAPAWFYIFGLGHVRREPGTQSRGSGEAICCSLSQALGLPHPYHRPLHSSLSLL